MACSTSLSVRPCPGRDAACNRPLFVLVVNNENGYEYSDSRSHHHNSDQDFLAGSCKTICSARCGERNAKNGDHNCAPEKCAGAGDLFFIRYRFDLLMLFSIRYW